MEIHIRLLDTHGARLTETQQRLQQCLQQHGLVAHIEPIACHLEISRQGFMEELPILQINGYTVSRGQALDNNFLHQCCKRLALWQKNKRAQSL